WWRDAVASVDPADLSADAHLLEFVAQAVVEGATVAVIALERSAEVIAQCLLVYVIAETVALEAQGGELSLQRYQVDDGNAVETPGAEPGGQLGVVAGIYALQPGVAVEWLKIDRATFDTDGQTIKIAIVLQGLLLAGMDDEADVQLLVADAGQEMDVVEALLGEQHARYQIDSSGTKVFQAAQEREIG